MLQQYAELFASLYTREARNKIFLIDAFNKVFSQEDDDEVSSGEDDIMAPKPIVPCQTNKYIENVVDMWEDEMLEEVEKEENIEDDEVVAEEEDDNMETEEEVDDDMGTEEEDDGEGDDGNDMETEEDVNEDDEEERSEVRVRRFYWVGDRWSETDPDDVVDDGNIGNELIDLSETNITIIKEIPKKQDFDPDFLELNNYYAKNYL
ncbi:hypothetical protein Glove_23g226 [Diversispora epigaea]|uniref:Uncharacterized protein n=1 Tax=Diversispora epigaea TaxID=1348612 RepID=A0A397JNI1_9GLOM|nr:hypothetical protein Glove_23g226 [Diversispora epigaea]